MNSKWQPQATIALACTVLLAVWLSACYALDSTPWAAGGFCMAMFAAAAIDLFGILAAVSGVLIGSKASRRAAIVCLVLLLVPPIAVVSFFLWISTGKQRWA